MTRLLAIETATDVCSVALCLDGRVVGSLATHRPRRHAELLVPMIRELLDTSGVEPALLDGVAVSAGPGSYTGLRIGVSTAKGLVTATGADFIPVPSLQALAWRCAQHVEDGTTVIAAFGARRGEVYAAAFRIYKGAAQPLGKAVAGEPGEAIIAFALEPATPIAVVGDGRHVMAAALRSAGLSPAELPILVPAASAVAMLALHQPRAEDPADVDAFEPYYLRDFTARPATRSVYDRLPF